MRTRKKNRPDTSALLQLGLDAVFSRLELEQLARDTDIIDVPAGEQLCRTGAPARELIGILDGYVDLVDDGANRRIAGPGTRIGGRPADAVAAWLIDPVTATGEPALVG